MADDATAAARVYVGNLKPKANETHITQAFARFGAIASVWVARKPPGFAFVAYEDARDALRAVQAFDDAHPLEILGKRVKVQLAGGKPSPTNDRDERRPVSRSRERQSPKTRRDGHKRSVSRSRSRSRSMSPRRHRRERSSPRRRRKFSRSPSNLSSSRRRRRSLSCEAPQRRRRSSSRSSRERSLSRPRRSRSRSMSPRYKRRREDY